MAHSSDTVTGRRVIQSRTVDRSSVFTAQTSVQRERHDVHYERPGLTPVAGFGDNTHRTASRSAVLENGLARYAPTPLSWAALRACEES
jgi:hypothetical protein